MIKKNVTETKAQLSSLLESVENGETVLISRGSRPVAKIIPFKPEGKIKNPGKLRGKIKIASDFDKISPEIMKMFKIK